ncbi:hypothetical protein [Streptomyces sp. GESEQ-4]|uniref:esterase/lipase family protein n=1 Tax=Streptomyces sp. GESEQ-4 TaxID=2812655 RepID=UPI0027DCFEB6|nr:hypothetical protein [Streptomyces sp. GESEQ-4]
MDTTTTRSAPGRAVALFVAMLVSLSALAWWQAPAAEAATAAPRPGNGANDTVYFIKGYTPDGISCKSKWGAATQAMRSWGWTGKFVRVGLYAADTRSKGCAVNLLDPHPEQGTVNVPIKDLGKALAWDIYNNYSSKEKSVDLVGHSMGGLIARAAIAGVQRHEEGWPERLYVEDVVTLGTPHRGTFTNVNDDRQSKDMVQRSDFINWLNETPNPQAEGGTDWTLIGSGADEAVAVSSATPAPAEGWSHLVRYSPFEFISHSALRTTTRGSSYSMNYFNKGTGWRQTDIGAAPIRVTHNALYWARKW